MPVRSGSKAGGGTTAAQRLQHVYTKFGNDAAMAEADRINAAMEARKRQPKTRQERRAEEGLNEMRSTGKVPGTGRYGGRALTDAQKRMVGIPLHHERND